MKSWQPGDPLLRLEPIGVVRTGLVEKAVAPRQPRAAEGLSGRIELFPGRDFEHALEDLESWECLWVIFWFHLNESWRPKVLPPRSTSGRKGVFSTRSPHRPNPIGLSVVRLEGIRGLTLLVADVDMVDGTPVLDLKPYVPYTDSHPGASSGWLDEAGQHAGGVPEDPVRPWAVRFDPLAAEQARWVETRTELPLTERIITTLSLGPRPNPYRRIKPEGDGFRLSIRDWRIRFVVDGPEIRVQLVSSGYRPAQLAGTDPAAHASVTAHRAFVERWPRR